MNILLIGQCTLHWGRMEFGNIGNYYIIEPFVRELHATFSKTKIRTTFQMSQHFCEKEKVETLPMELYYGWSDCEFVNAQYELELSMKYKKTGMLDKTTAYIDAVLWSDLVVDFSGDIWGDNADFLGKNRFEIGLLKDQIAMNLGKKVAMIAGSPGPFSNKKTKELALKTYQNFDLVANREPISTKLLENDGFDMRKTYNCACPAFLFEPEKGEVIDQLLIDEKISLTNRKKPLVGFILCGWNFKSGPFDKWPREDSDYINFAEAVELLTEVLGVQVCLMSHSNGFDVPVIDFELKHGRDYPIVMQLARILEKRGIAKDVFTLDGVYDAWQTKAIIGSFDMLVSGRVHAAVAALSQCIPTVIIDYGHEPKAHKLEGFATVVQVQEYVANPMYKDDLNKKIISCWNNRVSYKNKLERVIPEVKNKAKMSFKVLKELF